VTKVHKETVMHIGDLGGPLADDINRIFINDVAYDGKSTDMPIMIASGSIVSLTAEQKQGISDAFLNGHPITLVQCRENEINALLGILGLEQDFTLPEGLPADKQYAEIFSIDMEEGGDMYVWSTFPPREGAMTSDDPDAPSVVPYVDSEKDQLARAELFHNWFDEDAKRATPEMKASREQATKALVAGAKAANEELTKLAHAFVVTRNFSDRGNNYQLTYFIYSCHSFNEADAIDYDWFYVRQEGLLNASNAYSGIINWRRDTPTTGSEYYVNSYSMNSWLDGFPSARDVSILKPSPENTNNEVSVTSGINWNVGGKVGISTDKKASFEVNGGVSVTNSSTFKVTDCQVTNNSGDKVNNANWRYEFKKAVQVAYFGYTGLKEAPLLSHSTFQPVNQWIWKCSPAVRNAKKKSFASLFHVDLIATVGGTSHGFWISEPIRHYSYPQEWKENIPLPFPPVIVAPRKLNFDKRGQFKAIELAVARPWNAASSETWCRVTPNSGSEPNPGINITVDDNNTGKDRTAFITFQTADLQGSVTMEVFQSQY
jgi:hypothetical protein